MELFFINLFGTCKKSIFPKSFLYSKRVVLIMSRRVTSIPAPPGKSSFIWVKRSSRARTVFNWFCLRMSQTFQFSQPIKQFFLRLEGIKIGKNVQIMPDVFFDIFFPWQITIEDDVVIGISSFISCHEFTPTEFKYGDVLIKKGVLIGAKSFILPGVIIGEGAFISPLTTVYKDIPDHVLAFGSPLQFKPMENKPTTGETTTQTETNKSAPNQTVTNQTQPQTSTPAQSSTVVYPEVQSQPLTSTQTSQTGSTSPSPTSPQP